MKQNLSRMPIPEALASFLPYLNRHFSKKLKKREIVKTAGKLKSLLVKVRNNKTLSFSKRRGEKKAKNRGLNTWRCVIER